MIWAIIAVLLYRWTKRLGTSEVEEWQSRVDTLAQLLLVTGVLLLVALFVSLVGLAYADSSFQEAAAIGDAAGAAFWDSMRHWLLYAAGAALVL